MAQKKVLFVSQKKANCGVYEFGKNIANVLNTSTRYTFIYQECESLQELHAAIDIHHPIAIIYNYHSSTLSWVTKKIVHTMYKSLIKDIKIPQIGMIHEVTQQKVDEADDKIFDYYIAADPTLLLKNPIVFKTGRLVPPYQNNYSNPEITTIGSFGFATPNKGFQEIVRAVNNEFDKAIIRFNIPFAEFGDKDGSHARALVATCKQLITKKEIELVIKHDFLSDEQVLDFLAQNSINVFLYQDKKGRGLSSTVDYALAVNRPLAVSDSIMFRHLHTIKPSIVYGESTLQQILEQGTRQIEHLKREWSAENLVWEYNRIIDAVLNLEKQKEEAVQFTTFKHVKNSVRSALGLKKKSFTWLRDTKVATEDNLTVDRSQSYTPVEILEGSLLNRILDNSARALYKPAIEKLTSLVPLTMAKKIAEANVQQAFVFDTVIRSVKNYSNPKLLCVGSYEDTASMGLIKMGYEVEEIDPMLNYFLQEYYSKPTTKKESFDIIFSTSVIEHDPNDESFLKCIEGLLKPGGTAIITCDYKDGWKPGDIKPDVDARLYTKDDLKNRLPSYIPNCYLIDQPQWDCHNPDFHYLGKYIYTFATFVFKKK